MKEAEKNDKFKLKEEVKESSVDINMVQLLSDQTGISVEDIKSIFEHSKGDLEKLIDIIKDVAPCYMAIKGKFQSKRQGDLNGAFCLVAQGVTGDILVLKSWVDFESLSQSFDIKATWESVFSYICKLENVKYKQAQRRFEDLLYNFFTNTTLNRLFTSNLSLAELQKSLSQAIANTFRSALVLDIDIEKFNQIRYKLSPVAGKSAEEGIPQGQEGQENLQQAVKSVTLACVPRLDVIKGKAVADLRENDEIEVSIASSYPLGKFMNRLFATNKLMPVFKVKSVQQLPSGAYMVRLFISDGIEGVFKSSGELKVRTMEKANQRKKSLYFFVFLTLIMLIGFFVLFFVFRR